jgi:hypothetical protein
MAQVDIDIPVSPELQDALNTISCDVLEITAPTPLSITLPGGAALQSFVDLSKGVPNDCSMTFSLVLQLAPFLASITCLLRILKLLKPLIDVIKGITSNPLNPPVAAVEEFVAAAVDLAPCLLLPADVLEFAKDIICFIRSLLKCLVSQLTSVYNILTTLGLRIEAAAGNEDLLNTLNCAQQNAQASMQTLTLAIDPIMALLDLAQPVLSMAGLNLSFDKPASSSAGLEGLQDLITALQAVITTIDALGICSD